MRRKKKQNRTKRKKSKYTKLPETERILKYLRQSVALYQTSDLSGAEKSCRRLLEMDTENADALHILGLVLLKKGRLTEAGNSIRHALGIRPSAAIYHNSLGNVLQASAQYASAIESYRKALEYEGRFPEAYYNLGTAYEASGDFSNALECYAATVYIEPEHVMALNNMANLLNRQGREGDAAECYKRALSFRPDLPELNFNYANLLHAQVKPGDAAGYFIKAIQVKPDYADAYHNLGIVYKDQGRISEAVECSLKAQELAPDNPVFSGSHLMISHYFSDLDPDALYRSHRKWGRFCEDGLPDAVVPHGNDRSAGRRLRIGYVSADFRGHSVAYFIRSIIAAHDKQAFDVVCYSDVAAGDTVTEEIRALSGEWRDIHGMPNEDVAALIRRDKTDILVDLSGHTSCDRLHVFAMKPAPVQVTYLGYPNTTGLKNMDYRFTDAVADPPGKTDHLHTEKLVRLPNGFLCFSEPADQVKVRRSPTDHSGTVTFGSFNHRAKITPEVIKIWSEILISIKDSRLILKHKVFSDPETVTQIKEQFTCCGVSHDRLTCSGYTKGQGKHLEKYNSVDIALDTFPYNGTTTTCEALWMGVPVIVLEGDSHVARTGCSLLSSVGITELIAASTEEYLNKAVNLAGDPGRRMRYHSELRNLMRRSSLMDAKCITQDIENAFQWMWKQWCGN